MRTDDKSSCRLEVCFVEHIRGQIHLPSGYYTDRYCEDCCVLGFFSQPISAFPLLRLQFLSGLRRSCSQRLDIASGRYHNLLSALCHFDSIGPFVLGSPRLCAYVCLQVIGCVTLPFQTHLFQSTTSTFESIYFRIHGMVLM